MSFGWKLVGALLLTAMCAAAGTYWLATRALSDRFDEFRAQNLEVEAKGLAGLLGQYWEAEGSWTGVQRWFSAQVFIERGGRVLYQRSMLGQFALLDANYDVVACVEEQWAEAAGEQGVQRLAEREGIPVVADGRQVGILIPLEGAALTPLEEDFLRSVQRAALVGGAVALALAALLGTFLIVQLSSPLRRLIRATERLAQGDLAYRVQARSKDEIGRLARAFNRMARALQQSESARKNLLADVAHELRTPLTVIQGNLEAMLDGVFPLSTEDLAPVYEETLHMGALIEDLRVLTLAEAGHLPLRRQAVNLGELVQGACEAIRPAAAEGEVDVDAEVAPDLWVDGDPHRLRQVVANLLANALRHSPAGTAISVHARRVGVEAWVTVHDRGDGISPEDLPHIFERFYRADRSRSGEGTGLGLAIAQELVRVHGGRIWAENDGGAVFTFALPVVAPGGPQS
ncbi:MAG: sensor histidine kinase [Candidatus Bipolaricaulaceae bacterium]